MSAIYCAKQIELLRMKLLELVNSHGNFTDEKVVRLSQQLDEYLVEYQKMMDRGETAPYVVKFPAASKHKTALHWITGTKSRSYRR